MNDKAKTYTVKAIYTVKNKYFLPEEKSHHHKLSAAVAAIRKLERQWKRSVGWSERSIFPYYLTDQNNNLIDWWE